MATLEKIKSAVSDFILSSMVPRMDETRQFLAGAGTVFLMRKADQIVREIAKKEWVCALGLFDGNGNIDVDTAFESMMVQFKRQPKFPVEIPFFGCFSFTAHDIQELYDKIKSA